MSEWKKKLILQLLREDRRKKEKEKIEGEGRKKDCEIVT